MQTPSTENLASAADQAACRALIRQGSKSFFAASLLLPVSVREPALALYAFCRLADDLVDGSGRSDPLALLEARLELAYQGRPGPEAADRAFADVVKRYAIPRALPQALLEGFCWDAQGRRYEDMAQLRQYAARVAGSVGAMMTCILGVRAPTTVSRACDLGVAMQLTNIARDVGEDALAGRLYLPLAWLRDAGIDAEDFLRSPRYSPALGTLIERLLRSAEDLYERASAGIADLPRDCRRGIYAARFLYAEIGHELRRNGMNSVDLRTVVPLPRKAALLTRALRAADSAASVEPAVPLPETTFLVDAVQAEPGIDVAAPAPANLTEKVAWLVDLFERLERRDRPGAAIPGSATG
jgi:phytoene synthase